MLGELIDHTANPDYKPPISMLSVVYLCGDEYTREELDEDNIDSGDFGRRLFNTLVDYSGSLADLFSDNNTYSRCSKDHLWQEFIKYADEINERNGYKKNAT